MRQTTCPLSSGGISGLSVASQPLRQCRVCGSESTINAHLFPRALMHDLKADQKNLFVGSVLAPGRSIVQAGSSDTGILCAEHDGVLGAYDRYGTEFCRSFGTKSQHVIPDVWELYDVDTEALVKFWLAILWRCSISSLPQTANLMLGHYEDQLQAMLFGTAVCSLEPAITILRYRSRSIPPENVCFMPYPTAFPGSSIRHEAYGVAVAGLHAFIKVDSAPLSPEFHQITINGKQDVVGAYLQLEQTEQFKWMMAMAHNMTPKREYQRG